LDSFSGAGWYIGASHTLDSPAAFLESRWDIKIKEAANGAGLLEGVLVLVDVRRCADAADFRFGSFATGSS
jgi:hypothetical protein